MQYEAALAVDAIKLFTSAFNSILRKNNDFLQDAVTSRGDKLTKCTDDSEVKTGPGIRILQEMKTVREAFVCWLVSEDVSVVELMYLVFIAYHVELS